jgi:hypothetical protein
MEDQLHIKVGDCSWECLWGFGKEQDLYEVCSTQTVNFNTEVVKIVCGIKEYCKEYTAVHLIQFSQHEISTQVSYCYYV